MYVPVIYSINAVRNATLKFHRSHNHNSHKQGLNFDFDYTLCQKWKDDVPGGYFILFF